MPIDIAHGATVGREQCLGSGNPTGEPSLLSILQGKGSAASLHLNNPLEVF